ncbi:excisionase [Nocardia sp. FDAARGOS_372]|uniref:DUF2637 domain-containing protein n=1 Tax=Nocardia sp. FDAARGOS_372 TaxID=2018066 RepID=UPI000BEF707A|nr:DUF2637 domain-containing protein [Nocardia sp. FDAARGOS_372]PEH78927.1 excisionase [Nocardia sp. FDAARGOS_372]
MSAADQQSKSKGVRWARWSAVLVVLAIGGAAFVLSFAALRDLAIKAHTPTHLAWLFPVIVDGTIIQATIAVLALADSPERRWFTGVLAAGAAVSIGGNVAHSLVSGHGYLAALLAVIAPAALLIDTHGLAVLLRTRRASERSEPADAPSVVPAAAPTPTPRPAAASVPTPQAVAVSPVPVRPIATPPRVVQPPRPVRPVVVPAGS